MHIIRCRCDIGPKLAFEAVGTIDSRLRTVTFLADKPSKEDTATSADQKAKSTKKSKAPSKAPLQELALAGGTKSAVEESPFNEPGVVFYLDEKNIVKGILLWNLANDYFDDPEYISPQRLNVARKVLNTSILWELKYIPIIALNVQKSSCTQFQIKKFVCIFAFFV